MNEAVDELGLEKNPIMKVKGLDTSDHVTYTEEEPNALTPEEVQPFLAAMRDRHPQHFAMVALGFATGWRPSMMRPLRRTGPTPDVLWDRNVVLARRSRIWLGIPLTVAAPGLEGTNYPSSSPGPVGKDDARMLRSVYLTLSRRYHPVRLPVSTFYLIGALAAALFALPYFWCDWHVDDLFITGTAHSNHPWMNQPWDLYRFSSGDPSAVAAHIHDGSFPWWTHPEWRYALWRPLTSLLLSADHAVFGHQLLGYRADSLIWYVLLTISAGAVFRRTLGPSAGLVAVVIFAFSRPHLELMGWEAARHHIVSVTFAMAALSAHLRGRDGWRPGRVLSIVLAALGLLAGEAALSGLAYWIAYELTERRPLKERMLGIAPCVGTILVYLVVYTATKHGMHGGGSHIDPFDDPWEFCRNIPRRALVMFVAVFSGAPLFPDRVHLVLPFLIGAVALALSHADAGERRLLRWYVLGSALSLAPQLGGDLGDRNLLAATVGMSALMGFGLHRSWALLRDTAAPKKRRFIFALTMGVFGVAHLILPARAMSNVIPEKLALTSDWNARLFATKGPWDGHGNVLMIGPDNFLGGQLLGFIVWHRTGIATRSWGMLTPACDGIIQRVDANTIEWTSSPTRGLQSIYRDMKRYPITLGERVRTPLFEASVREVDGGWPKRVSYRFDAPVDAPDLYFVIPRREIEQLRMPTVGERVELPPCNEPEEPPTGGAVERAVRYLFDDL